MRQFLLGIALSLLPTFCMADWKISVTPDRTEGVYNVNDPVTWKIKIDADNDQPVTGTLKYEVLSGGSKQIAKGDVPVKNGLAEVKSQRATPGVLLLKTSFNVPETTKVLSANGGAVYDPEDIKASSDLPADFDKFWEGKIAELKSVPVNAQLTKIEIGDSNIEYYHITFDNIGGKKIRGQLAKPAGKTNLPALLQVQYAGVYPLKQEWVVNHAKNGWLALNISAHDLPIDEPAEFYKKQSENELKTYRTDGNNDRDRSYFLPVFLGCYRAVDYLAHHPDWDKKTLFVHGSSQGGYLAIVSAGIHPAVTGMAGNVPAGCDHTGRLVERSPGWPVWSQIGRDEDAEKTLQVGRYFDAMNFARKIRCPITIGVGLIDTTCPPEGIFATINQAHGAKRIVIMPLADHGSNLQAYFPALTEALKEAKAPR